MTVEAWIHPTGADNNGIIVNKEGEYEIARFPDGHIQWAIASGGGWGWVDTGYVAPLDTWTHIAVVFDAGTVKTFANGVLVHTGSTGAATIGDTDGNANDFRIGNRQSTEQGFVGQIDDVRVWNVARSAEDIAAGYTQLLTGNETGLVGNWRMDEAGGSTVVDRSAAGNDGSIGPSSETRVYTFHGDAGDRLYFDIEDRAGEPVYWRLLDPAGNLVFGPSEMYR